MTLLDARSPQLPAPSPSRPVADEADAAAEVDAATDHVAAALAAMATRVALDHPEADLAELHERVHQAYARFEGAPVQAFREILSERAVRRDLLVARARLGDGARGDR